MEREAERRDDDVIVRVCDCGVIATDWAKARCGRNGVKNIQAACPTRLMRIVAWEDVDDARRRPSPEAGE